MKLYAWVTPAFVTGAPVDHTWVTTYDSGLTMYDGLADLIAAGEHYWFCGGDFHKLGESDDFTGGQLLQLPFQAASLCLVPPDDKTSVGTVVDYGIDGVCHQMANQVLFPSGGRVTGARGYKLSSAIFGTFGRRAGEWQKNCGHCQMPSPAFARAPASARPLQPARFRPLLSSRARYFFEGGTNTTLPLALSRLTDALHQDIDQIGFALPTRHETAPARAGKLNQRINAFLMEVAKTVNNDDFFRSAFDLEPGEEINLIDPELFVFPQRN